MCAVPVHQMPGVPGLDGANAALLGALKRSIEKKSATSGKLIDDGEALSEAPHSWRSYARTPATMHLKIAYEVDRDVVLSMVCQLQVQMYFWGVIEKNTNEVQKVFSQKKSIHPLNVGVQNFIFCLPLCQARFLLSYGAK